MCQTLAAAQDGRMARNHLLNLESLLSFAITACTGPGDLSLGRSVGHLYVGHGWCHEAGLIY